MLYQTPTLSFRVTTGSLSKIHVIVSKKIFIKAVDRNLLKRRIRNSVNQYLKTLPKNKILFFYTKKDIRNKKYKEINSDVEILLKKAKLY